jgi:hypothetical protein
MLFITKKTIRNIDVSLITVSNNLERLNKIFLFFLTVPWLIIVSIIVLKTRTFLIFPFELFHTSEHQFTSRSKSTNASLSSDVDHFFLPDFSDLASSFEQLSVTSTLSLMSRLIHYQILVQRFQLATNLFDLINCSLQ